MTIREELELDVSSAEESLDGLEGTLESIASSFGSELEEAIEVLQSIAIEEIDTEGISESISEAVESADSEIDVEADVTAAEGSINSLGAEDIEIEVDADTSSAQEEIDGLGETSADAVGSIGDLSGATGVLTGAAAGATVPVGELFQSIEAGSGLAVGATAAVAALGFSFGVLLPNAIEASSTMQSFNARTGDAAGAVELLDENLFGAETTIGVLAQSLGSNDEAVRNAVARLFEFAEASEFSSGRAEQFSEEVLALATRAVTLNPSLGDIGDVVNGLSTGLSRGGRRLTNYGLELTRTEIEARALANTGKLLSTELNEAEKAEAGAQLATEKLGDALGGDILANADNVALTFGRFQQILGDTLEEIGKPLIFPLFDLIEAGTPIALNFAQILADLTGGIAGLLTPAAEGLSPIIDTVSESVGRMIDAAGPGLEALGVGLGDFFEDIEPAIDGATESLEGFGQAIGVAGETLGFAFSGLGDVVSTLNDIEEGAANLWETLGAPPPLADSLGFIIDFAGTADPFTRLAQSLDAIGFDESGFEADEWSDSVFGASESAEDFSNSLDDAQGNLARLALEHDLGTVRRLSEEFEEAGISASEYAGFLLQGENAQKDFTDAVKASGASEDVINTLSDAFANARENINEAAEVQVESLRQSGAFTDAQLDAALAVNQNADGTFNYIGALQELGPILDQETAKEEERRATLAQNGQAWVDLAQSVINGTIASSDYGAAAEQLGVDLSTVETFVKSVQGALDTFSQAAIQQLPQVSAAFEGLGEATDPQQVIQNLEIQALAVALFEENIRLLLAFGLDDLAELALQRGPEFTNALIGAFQQGRPGLAAELEATLEGTKGQLAATETAIREEFAPQLVDAASIAALAATDAYGEGINFSGVTTNETSTIPPAIANAQPGIDTAASSAGIGATQSFAGGLSLGAETQTGATAVQGVLSTVFGVSDPLAVLQTAAAGGDAVSQAFLQGMSSGLVRPSFQRDALELSVRGLISNVESWARDEAEANSPSKLFARLSEDIVRGYIQGIESESLSLQQAGQFLIDTAITNPRLKLPDLQVDSGVTVLTVEVSIGEINVGEGQDPKAVAEEVAKRTGKEVVRSVEAIVGRS